MHRQSVVDADATWRYHQAVTTLAASHPDASRYLTSLAGATCSRLTRRELEAAAGTSQIVAGVRAPERSVATGWLADRFVAALAAEPRIELRLGRTVTSVEPGPQGLAGPLRVRAGDGSDGPFDFVVNALWEGRLAIDARLGLALPDTWSHRYRVAMFLRTAAIVHVPSTVIATGPFGDVKNYNGRDLYLSWYPVGVLAQGERVEAPVTPAPGDAERHALAARIVAGLATVLPDVSRVSSLAEVVHVAGGWVYAAGRGLLSDPRSTLHRRDRVGIRRCGTYVSVDTGKYSIAPWLAQTVARDLW